METLRMVWSVVVGRSIIISKVSELNCKVIVGRNITNEFAKNSVATTLRTLISV